MEALFHRRAHRYRFPDAGRVFWGLRVFLVLALDYQRRWTIIGGHRLRDSSRIGR